MYGAVELANDDILICCNGRCLEVSFSRMAGQKRVFALDVPASSLCREKVRRGCPVPQASLRSLLKADCYAGMTIPQALTPN